MTALKTRVIVALQGSYGYEYDISQHPDDIATLKAGADWWHANRDWLATARSEIQDQSPRMITPKSHRTVRALPCGSCSAIRHPMRWPHRLEYLCGFVQMLDGYGLR